MKTNQKPELLYTLFCDDVRLETGNKLSFMGVFEAINVEHVPVSLIKFAVVNHWQGEGEHLTEVRVLSESGAVIMASQPTVCDPSPLADNISFFVNVTFPTAGQYTVQTLIDSQVVEERSLIVCDSLGDNESVSQ